MSQLIQYADFGIDEIQVRATGATSGSAGGQGVDPRLSFDGVPDEIMDYINTELKWSLNNELVFHHVSEDGGGWLSQAMESDGTLAGLAFLSVALRTLKNGRVMLVDEIERSLHPVLVKGLISLFTDIRTNPHQAQLIFTSHDALSYYVWLWRGWSTQQEPAVVYAQGKGWGVFTLPGYCV